MVALAVGATVTNWGDALKTSVADALSLFLGAIPKIIGFIIIVIIGWFIASLIAKVATRVLRDLKFNELADRSGISKFIRDMGVNMDAAAFLADIVKWFIRLIVLVTAFDELGLPAVSAVLQRLLLWLPNLVVALVILVIAGIAATALSKLVRGVAKDAGLSSPDLLAKVTQVTVLVFGVLIAVNQIGVASNLINDLFLGFVAALALALGLAFGLGGRDTAGEIVQTWYQQGKEKGPKLAEAAKAQQQGGSQNSTQPAQAPFIQERR